MPEKNSKMMLSEARKQLLLSESELNRMQMLQELDDFKTEIHHLGRQAGEIMSFASSAATVVTTLATTFSAIRSMFSHRDGPEKDSWISKLLGGAKGGGILSLLLRTLGRKGPT